MQGQESSTGSSVNGSDGRQNYDRSGHDQREHGRSELKRGTLLLSNYFDWLAQNRWVSHEKSPQFITFETRTITEELSAYFGQLVYLAYVIKNGEEQLLLSRIDHGLSLLEAARAVDSTDDLYDIFEKGGKIATITACLHILQDLISRAEEGSGEWRSDFVDAVLVLSETIEARSLDSNHSK